MRFKKISYLLAKALKDFISPLIYEVDKKNIDVSKNTYLGKYYFLFDKNELITGGSYFFKFDSNNIPIVKGNSADNDESFYYNPQAICQYALSLFNEYIELKNTQDLKDFLNISDWLVDNVKYLNDIPYWESDEKRYTNIYAYDDINLISSMSQSRVISVLLRAYQVTNSNIYLEICEKSVKAYETEYSKGSFLVRKDNLIIFEENGMPGILNHFIFAIFGLMDYCRFKGDDTSYKKLLESAIYSLKEIISTYDIGWWSLYDDYAENGRRRINPATRHYHNIHIQQLFVMYLYTNDDFFLNVSRKFKSYDTPLNRLKMLFYKFVVVKKMGRL